jgi:hypothetical protein
MTQLLSWGHYFRDQCIFGIYVANYALLTQERYFAL